MSIDKQRFAAVPESRRLPHSKRRNRKILQRAIFSQLLSLSGQRVRKSIIKGEPGPLVFTQTLKAPVAASFVCRGGISKSLRRCEGVAATHRTPIVSLAFVA